MDIQPIRTLWRSRSEAWTAGDRRKRRCGRSVRGLVPGLPVTLGLVIGAGVFAGCGLERGEAIGFSQQPLTAYCQAVVVGVGTLDTETEYLPNVINCENGDADFVALKALAIAARSVLYYKMEGAGQIRDGTGDQVYSCARSSSLNDEHRRAVRETSGLVLRYSGTQVYGFYVAGALQEPPACVGGTLDETGTEYHVTYNEGRSGAGLVQSPLGLVDPGNHANRGCLSQNGSHCLAQAGRSYEEILHFYYGADIEIEQAEGGCVTPIDPPTEPTPDAGMPIEPPPAPMEDGGPPPPVDPPTVPDGGPRGMRVPGVGLQGSGCVVGGVGDRGRAWPMFWVLAVPWIARWRRRPRALDSRGLHGGGRPAS